MENRLRQTLRGYAVAVVSVAVAAAVRFSLTPFLDHRLRSSPFLIAILVASRYGGYGPSWLALALGSIPVAYLQLVRTGTLDALNPAAQTAIAMYLVLGTLIVLLAKSERIARDTAEKNAADALHKQRLLEREIAERKAIEQQLRERQQQLELALQAGNLGIWSWDIKTGQIKSTETQAIIHGRSPDSTNRAFAESLDNIHPDDRHVVKDAMERAMRDEAPKRVAYRTVWPDSSIHWVESVGQVFHDESGNPNRVLGVSIDITQRKATEDALRTKESQLRGILDHTPAVIYLKDLQGRYVLVNRRHQMLFVHHGDDVIGKNDLEWFPEIIAKAFMEADRKVLEEQAPLVFEEVALHDDGPHTYRSVKFPVKDDADNVIALGGISTDISDLKVAHEALKKQEELLRNLIDVQENEKRFLCHEFHDGLIQYAVGALFLLEGYRQPHPSPEESATIDTVIGQLRKGVDDGRRVIRGIRPSVLDDSNVEAAIHDLIDQFSTSGILVTCNCDPEIGRLPESFQTTIYRVVQEALNNARKHSGTDVIRIELRKSNGDLHLEVWDFGCGFDVKSARTRGFGLLGMTERVRLLGGECSITSEKDAGTRITARLPIPVTDVGGE